MGSLWGELTSEQTFSQAFPVKRSSIHVPSQEKILGSILDEQAKHNSESGLVPCRSVV